MTPKTRISVIKELDKLKRINSRNSYTGACIYAALIIDPLNINNRPDYSRFLMYSR